MNINELLPIGSVVLLKDGQKKVMVIGVKQTDLESNEEYDYLSVIYPEGFISDDTMFFFNHESIDKVFFTGYEDDERKDFIGRLTDFYNSQNDSSKE